MTLSVHANLSGEPHNFRFMNRVAYAANLVVAVISSHGTT
jgi:hypothetical protein